MIETSRDLVEPRAVIMNAAINGDHEEKVSEDELTLLDFLLADFPQFVHIWRRACDGALNDFCPSSQGSPCSNRICCRNGLNLDDTDPGVFWATIMLAIFEITKPCL